MHTLTPSGSEGASGSRNPRHRRRGSRTLPLCDPLRKEVHAQSGGSARSLPLDGGRPWHVRARCCLTYHDGSSPQGALQAAGALLRHPPGERGAGGPRPTMVGRRRQLGHHCAAAVGREWPFHCLRYVTYLHRPLLVSKEEGPSDSHSLKAIYGPNVVRGLRKSEASRWPIRGAGRSSQH